MLERWNTGILILIFFALNIMIHEISQSQFEKTSHLAMKL